MGLGTKSLGTIPITSCIDVYLIVLESCLSEGVYIKLLHSDTDTNIQGLTCLPPRVHHGAPPSSHHLMVPLPCLVIQGFSNYTSEGDPLIKIHDVGLLTR